MKMKNKSLLLAFFLLLWASMSPGLVMSKEGKVRSIVKVEASAAATTSTVFSNRLCIDDGRRIDDGRSLLFWAPATVMIDSPADGFFSYIYNNTTLEVKVSYDAKKPFLSFLFGFRGLNVLLNDEVIAGKSLAWFFGLFGVNSGSETFSMDLGAHKSGQHSLKVQADAVTSQEIAFTTADLPANVQKFVDETFVPGLTHEESSGVEENDNGRPFHVDANLTFIESGVISLAAQKSLVDKIQCSLDGTVAISLLEEIERQEAADIMFPAGTMLVIDSDVYGGCHLEKEDKGHEPFASPDGYLVVKTVVLSADKKQMVVSGSSSSFFFMFDESNVTMHPVPGPGEGTLNRHLLGNHTNDRSLVSFGGNKRFGNPPPLKPVWELKLRWLLMLVPIGTLVCAKALHWVYGLGLVLLLKHLSRLTSEVGPEMIPERPSLFLYQSLGFRCQQLES